MDNPYVSAAEGGLSAAAHFASALQSAATAQAARKEADRKQGLAEQLDMARLLNEGWEEYQPSQNVQSQSSGLKTRDYQPPPSSLVTLPHIGPNGKQLYRPDQTGKQKQAAQQQSFTDLRSALDAKSDWQAPNASGNVDQYPTTPRAQMNEDGQVSDTGTFGAHVAPPDDWERLPVPNGPTLYRPGPAERQYNTQRADTSKREAVDAEKNYALPDAVAAKLEQHAGLPPGTLKGMSVPRTELRGFIQDLADKKVPPHVVTSGFSAPLVIDPATGKATAVQLPPGVKPSLTPAQEETSRRFSERQDDRKDARQQREEDKAQTSRNSAQAAIDKLQEKEQGLHALRSEWGNVLSTPADPKTKGDPTVIDPETKREVTLNAARRKYYEQKINDAGEKVAMYQDAQKKLVGRNGGQAEPSGQAQQQKSAALSHVRAYAQQKKITEAQAVREFKAAGFTIGQ